MKHQGKCTAPRLTQGDVIRQAPKLMWIVKAKDRYGCTDSYLRRLFYAGVIRGNVYGRRLLLDIESMDRHFEGGLQ